MDSEQLAKWVVATVLMYGGSVATAYQVAGLFVAGVEAARKESPHG